MMTSTFGPAYVEERDGERISSQRHRIYALLSEQQWFTLAEIEAQTGDPQASISSQPRHLRKPKFGEHTVLRRHIADGVHQYQLHLHHTIIGGECVEKQCGHKQGGEEQGQQQLF